MNDFPMITVLTFQSKKYLIMKYIYNFVINLIFDDFSKISFIMIFQQFDCSTISCSEM